VGKMKKILNIEAGLEMIALGVMICSEVGTLTCIALKNSDALFLNKNSGVFPELAKDVKALLRRYDFMIFVLSDY